MRMVVSGSGHDIQKYRFLKVNMMFAQSIFLGQFFPTILSCSSNPTPHIFTTIYLPTIQLKLQNHFFYFCVNVISNSIYSKVYCHQIMFIFIFLFIFSLQIVNPFMKIVDLIPSMFYTFVIFRLTRF